MQQAQSYVCTLSMYVVILYAGASVQCHFSDIREGLNHKGGPHCPDLHLVLKGQEATFCLRSVHIVVHLPRQLQWRIRGICDPVV